LPLSQELIATRKAKMINKTGSTNVIIVKKAQGIIKRSYDSTIFT